jgi:hypothetical protein
MTDDLKPTAEILPPRSAASEAIEIARLAVELAAARGAAAHRSAVADLDRSTDITLRDLMETSAPVAATPGDQDSRRLVLVGMENRVLLLADALQKHALLRIMDAGAAIDAISRGAASQMEPDPVKPRRSE